MFCSFRRLYPPRRLRGWGRLSSDLGPLLLHRYIIIQDATPNRTEAQCFAIPTNCPKLTLISPLRGALEYTRCKTQLSKLVEQATKGESCIIAKAGKPMVKVIPLGKTEAGAASRLGFDGGEIIIPALCTCKKYAIGFPHYVRPCLCQREEHSESQSGLFPTLPKGARGDLHCLLCMS